MLISNIKNTRILTLLGILYSANTIGWSFLSFNGNSPFESWFINGLIILWCYSIGVRCGLRNLMEF